MVSVRGQVMEYPYISTGIKGEMVRSGVDCNWKGKVVGTVGRRPVAIHSSGQTIFGLAHVEGITLSAGEEVDEVAGGGGGMGVDGIGKVGDWASERQAAGEYGAHFIAGSLAGKGARGGTRGMENKVSFAKELMGVRRMAEGDQGGPSHQLPFNSCWNVRVLHNLPPYY